MPEGDQTFFREDVAASGVIESWLGAGPSSRTVEVAVDDDQVVGYVTVIPHMGWSCHVGDLRLVVDPGRRRSGLGRRWPAKGCSTGYISG